MEILETPRLRLREVEIADAAFFLRLLNDPSWLQNIGDRGIRSPADAETYIKKNIFAHYEDYGYGMYVMQLRSPALLVGTCGLVKRDYLCAPDLGFALLPNFVGQGYVFEAARALILHAKSHFRIARLYAIVKGGNHRSVRLLNRLGFRYEGPRSTPEGVAVELYGRDETIAAFFRPQRSPD